MKKTINDAIHDPVQLAEVIRPFQGTQTVFPVDVFQIAESLNLFIKFARFESNQAGRYMQPFDQDDHIHLVVLSATDDIQRQRFTLAHEIAHYLRYVYAGISVEIIEAGKVDRKEEEKFVNTFASHLLAPNEKVEDVLPTFKVGDYVPLENIGEMSWIFGLSPLAMASILAYRFDLIDGETDPKILKHRVTTYLNDNTDYDVNKFLETKSALYCQVIDAYRFDLFTIDEHQERRKVIRYIYNEMAGEGIDISIEEVAEIFTDLDLHETKSQFMKTGKQRVIEALGQCEIYRMLAQNNLTFPSLHDIRNLHRRLYQYAPHPEAGGTFRTANASVVGSGLSVVGFQDLPVQWHSLSKEFDDFADVASDLSNSEYLKRALEFHYSLTVLHPFPDGNGRVARAFLNWLLKLRDIPFVFFEKEEMKKQYLGSLSSIDAFNDYKILQLLYMRAIISALAD